MARRKSSATTPEGRYIASRIQDARRRNLTNKEIAKAYGINERTVRKIIAGETPGTKIYKEKTSVKGPRSTPNVFTADIQIADNEVRSVNVLVPNYRNAKGESVPPTAFDLFRYPNLSEVADEEAAKMQRRYQMDACQRPNCGHEEAEHIEDGPCEYDDGCERYVPFNPVIVGMRPVATYRKVPVVIRGLVRR